jgi:putative transposase
MNKAKIEKAKETLKLTRLKRQTQRCKSIELKIDYSKLNKTQSTSLKMFFTEAKWLYNFILSQKDPFSISSKIATITILNKDKQLEQKELKYLPAKNKQDVVKILHQNIHTLTKVKNNGTKVGRLKFKSSYNSIDLSQYNVTHKIISKNKIKINGIKKPLIVYGLKQIKESYEIANAKLIQKASGYYIKLICYEFIKPEMIKNKVKGDVGIDFGIKNNLVTSDGEIFNVFVEETERLKRLQQKLAKQIKGSNNRYKTCIKIKREYEHNTNRKKDATNKIVNYLSVNYNKIYIQDEQLHEWHKKYGKFVQHSCMGLVKSKLKYNKNVFVIDKWFPSTKMCYMCGNINEIALSDRVYKCSCGLVEDRDVKAAKTIKHVGQCNGIYVPMESREFKSV